MNFNKLISDSSRYVGSSILSQGFSLIRAISIPLLFVPAQLGIWNIVNLVLTYSSHAQLGLMHGMNKEIPKMKGIKNPSEEKNIRNSIFWVNIFLLFLAFFITFIVSFYVSNSFKMPIRILSFVVVFQMLFYFYFSLLRSDSKFKIVSNGIFFLAGLSTFLVICFAYFFNNPINGAVAGLGISIGIVLLYWIIKGNYFFDFKISYASLKKCFLVGLPIWGIGVLDSLTVSIDRFFIASTYDEAQLGYYALGIMVTGLIGLIPGSISSVLYPTMIEEFSKKNDPKSSQKLLIIPSRIIWSLMTILIFFSIIFLPIIITHLLPNYIPSIKIIQILLFGAFFMSSSHIPAMFLISIDKQFLIIKTQIVCVFFIVLFDSIAVYLNYGIEVIAYGTCIGYIIYGMSCSVISLNILKKNKKELLKMIFYKTFPISVISLNYIFFQFYLEQPNYMIQTLSMLVQFAFLLFSLWIVNRDKVIVKLILEKIKNT